jgi:pimeloyl-ACP methyl ester carboxylesterase
MRSGATVFDPPAACSAAARWRPWRAAALAAGLTAAALLAPAAAQPASGTTPCRIKGIEQEVRCGSVSVPEDPDAAGGRRIDIHFAVVPAQARIKEPDPLFVLAGGPGQAATAIAAQMQSLLGRVNARRDIVYIDQRGTGRSNPLHCDAPAGAQRLTDLADLRGAINRLADCVRATEARADTRQYATWIAARDFDAVRAQLGAERINLWGGSYGTRAAVEYLRQFPARVRSVVIDGVAPATMALPASFAVDADASLRALLAGCQAEPGCARAYPSLESDLDQLLQRAERGTRIRARDPLTAAEHDLVLDRDLLGGLLRAPLYSPMLASAMPYALTRAAAGDANPLLTLALALGGAGPDDFAELMHFAVICAEDMPHVDSRARAAAAATRFGDGAIGLYEQACRKVPVRAVPDAFYGPPIADVPVLVLSGGLDPVTPPRHGNEIARSLPRVLHLTAPQLGHGISAHGCAPDLIGRFIRQAAGAGRAPFAGIEDGKDAGCLARLPAAMAFQPPSGGPRAGASR